MKECNMNAIITGIWGKFVCPAFKFVFQAVICGGRVFLFAAIIIIYLFIGMQYEKKEFLQAIAGAGSIALALTILQYLASPRAGRRKDLVTFWHILVIGVATHYSAIMIGVSFGSLISSRNGIDWNAVAVLIQQFVLNYAAWVLFNQYLQTNATNGKRPFTKIKVISVYWRFSRKRFIHRGRRRIRHTGKLSICRYYRRRRF